MDAVHVATVRKQSMPPPLDPLRTPRLGNPRIRTRKPTRTATGYRQKTLPLEQRAHGLHRTDDRLIDVPLHEAIDEVRVAAAFAPLPLWQGVDNAGIDLSAVLGMTGCLRRSAYHRADEDRTHDLRIANEVSIHFGPSDQSF